jgi:4,5-dihydroxyphthalate decarboxylase
MHVIALRRELVERNPWIAMNLLEAFEEAKWRSIERAVFVGSCFPIPWGYELARQAQESMGKDYWPYGIDANRPTLDAFLQYAYEQGVCHRKLEPEELFAAQVQKRARV